MNSAILRGASPIGVVLPTVSQTLAKRMRLALGAAAALTTAAIWGGALAMTRLGISGAGTLGPPDIVMLRFLGPAILLLPVLIRALPKLRKAGPSILLLLLAGGGAPFVLMASTGLLYAGSAEAGALLPGTMPLYVAIAAALAGERLGYRAVLGFCLVALAVGLIAGPQVIVGTPAGWGGSGLLLGAAALFAAYTLALTRADLGAWAAAAFLSAGTVIGFAPVYFLVFEPHIFSAAPADLLLQLVYQGIVSGIAAPVAFAAAVAKLGGPKAAAFGGLSPAAAALGGFLLVGEVPDPLTLAGVMAVSCGVVLVSMRQISPDT